MLKFTLTLILAVNIQLIHATVLLFVATNDEVILVVDSKQTYLSGRQAMVNKLNRAGNYYFAIGGITYDVSSNFSLENIVKSLLKKNGEFADLKKDMHIITDSLQSFLRRKQLSNPASYERFRKMDGSGQICIAHVENGQPMMIIYTYTLDSNKPVNVNPKWGVYFSSKIEKNKSSWQIYQYYDWTNGKYPAPSDIAANPLKYAKWFAKESIAHNKQTAGYPVKIVVCKKDGCKELPPMTK